MKKIFFIVCLAIAVSLGSYAQDTTKFHKNEFGLDLTPLLRYNFIATNQNTNIVYQPKYQVSYRRITKKGNLKVNLGGYTQQSEEPSLQADTIVLKRNKIFIKSRIGWEWVSPVSKRFELLYGPGIICFYNTSNWESGISGDYVFGNQAKILTLGLSLDASIRFKINSRMSLFTFTSLDLISTNSKQKIFYRPINNSIPNKPTEKQPDSFEHRASFNLPISLYFTFTL